ncbi:hypothetical protein SH139x_001708 [Planctomycetaceae bacterium SH139]
MSHLKCFSPDDDAQQFPELGPQENDSTEQMLDEDQLLEHEVVESLSELAAEVQQATQSEPQSDPQLAGHLELEIADDADETDADDSPGGLLAELERRQDAVLLQLDALNDEVERVLKDLGVRLDDAEAA